VPNAISHRPTWGDMYQNYPGEDVDRETLYNTIIQGKFKGQENTPYLINTCATRMSHALNTSGVKLGKAPSQGGTMSGSGGYYWIRVRDLKAEMERRFGVPDATLHHDKLVLPTNAAASPDLDPPEIAQAVLEARVAKTQQFLGNNLNGKHGIVVFDVSGWGDASGHFTLWDGERLVYVGGGGGEGSHNDPKSWLYYFWFQNLVHDSKKWLIQQTNTVKFWALV
jgi:hypothetical protein